MNWIGCCLARSLKLMINHEYHCQMIEFYKILQFEVLLDHDWQPLAINQLARTLSTSNPRNQKVQGSLSEETCHNTPFRQSIRLKRICFSSASAAGSKAPTRPKTPSKRLSHQDSLVKAGAVDTSTSSRNKARGKMLGAGAAARIAAGHSIGSQACSVQ